MRMLHDIFADHGTSLRCLPALYRFAALFLITAGLQENVRAEFGRYMEIDDYVATAYEGKIPKQSILWVAGDLRDSIETILGHKFQSLRVRYWQSNDTTVWKLDEVGKELPITIAVTIRSGSISNVGILEFRESRGWEVRYPFFTDQFRNARLSPDRQLDQRIDGITGATLSVSAVTRIARVALVFDEHINSQER